ncbi:MAG: undecaprenyl-diphosphatase UppP [Elusimicrobia bacterium]|nr:undecaprenyl-diphosphatase UppP [Elusimicrobiota bacterium]
MNLWEAAVLGTVQGATEFLPVSSSAHLVLIPHFLGWRDPGLAYDVALHWGTLVGVIFYFYRDWLRLLRAAVGAKDSPEARLFLKLMLASLPAASAGYLFSGWAEGFFRQPPLVARMLILFAFFLWMGDFFGARSRGENTLSWREALGVGLAQALAVFPGVSRSGATMTAGLLVGLSRQAAARFSFLLSVPIILGAGLLKLPELARSQVSLSYLAVGFFFAMLSGFFSIHFLLRFLQKRGFSAFVLYRFLLGFFILFFIGY